MGACCSRPLKPQVAQKQSTHAAAGAAHAHELVGNKRGAAQCLVQPPQEHDYAHTGLDVSVSASSQGAGARQKGIGTPDTSAHGSKPASAGCVAANTDSVMAMVSLLQQLLSMTNEKAQVCGTSSSCCLAHALRLRRAAKANQCSHCMYIAASSLPAFRAPGPSSAPPPGCLCWEVTAWASRWDACMHAFVPQVSHIMALLVQRLPVSYACLTALSANGAYFQHTGELTSGSCPCMSSRAGLVLTRMRLHMSSLQVFMSKSSYPRQCSSAATPHFVSCDCTVQQTSLVLCPVMLCMQALPSAVSVSSPGRSS